MEHLKPTEQNYVRFNLWLFLCIPLIAEVTTIGIIIKTTPQFHPKAWQEAWIFVECFLVSTKPPAKHSIKFQKSYCFSIYKLSSTHIPPEDIVIRKCWENNKTSFVNTLCWWSQRWCHSRNYQQGARCSQAGVQLKPLQAGNSVPKASVTDY